ncbi:MAG: PilT/PilU family type 4a pilus ATPase [Acidobacteria bacterium]|nr:PilT/PilU family type 4a pilus ATPase [Acidobacteriota bacterium]
MVFELIPADVKLQLPNQDEVKFIHPHALGQFEFSVRKSPSGFNVVVSLSAPSSFSSPVNPTDSPDVFQPEPSPQTAPQQVSPDHQLATDLRDPAPGDPSPKPSDLESAAQQFEIERANAKLNAAALEKTYETEPVAEYAAPEPVTEEPPISTAAEKPAAEYGLSVQPPVQQFAEYQPAPEITPPQEQIAQPIPSNTAPPAPAPAAVPISAPIPQISASPAVSVPNGQPRETMDKLFKTMAAIGASDLHMSVSMPPMVRKDGKMALLGEGFDELTADSLKTLLTSIMPKKNIEEFSEVHDTDFAYEIADLARFRANIFMDRKGMGGVFRIIPSDILTAETLGLSQHILDLCRLSKGLVVVTGPTGSGKSTTLCAMVDYINRDREDHIITIEDPIEFVHENKKCLVNQREVHNHTDSFKGALRAALREDPDILLVGEMRDLETISIAIETAETGHLVFGTLHTSTAPSTVDRIIDQFPADRQQQIRVMLSESLRGVIAQTLLPKVGGGRIAALEVLLVTPAISNLIREGKTFQIPSAMQTGKSKGMVMLNDAMIELCKKGIVEPKDAYIKAVDKTGFEMLLERNGLKI